MERFADHQKIRPAVFTEKHVCIDEDNNYEFKKMQCPFLIEHNYCSVYEAQPCACREYPYKQQKDFQKKLAIAFQNTMICPAVALIAEELKKIY